MTRVAGPPSPRRHRRRPSSSRRPAASRHARHRYAASLAEFFLASAAGRSELVPRLLCRVGIGTNAHVCLLPVLVSVHCVCSLSLLLYYEYHYVCSGANVCIRLVLTDITEFWSYPQTQVASKNLLRVSRRAVGVSNILMKSVDIIEFINDRYLQRAFCKGSFYWSTIKS